ncbi:MAG: glycosyltransferase family protein [Parafilimonas sp.]
MKILYAVQATGNGHISRAIELIPYLQQYGTIDIFLSGSNSSLDVNLPVKYRSKGISLFYTSKGGLHYTKTLQQFSANRILREAKALPVENYDAVLIDFESISSLSCKLKNIPCIGFGHQASFQSSAVPRPKHKSIRGEWILNNYAKATAYVGLHFEQYDAFIFNPVIKDAILKSEPKDAGHITVYLPHYTDAFVISYLKKITHQSFHLFSKTASVKNMNGNITVVPVDNAAFNESLIHCNGMITGAGFETPAEVLYLGKKLMCLPVKGQYEQGCNAAALKHFDVPIVSSLTNDFPFIVNNWLQQPKPKQLKITHSAADIVAYTMKLAQAMK